MTQKNSSIYATGTICFIIGSVVAIAAHNPIRKELDQIKEENKKLETTISENYSKITKMQKQTEQYSSKIREEQKEIIDLYAQLDNLKNKKSQSGQSPGVFKK